MYFRRIFLSYLSSKLSPEPWQGWLVLLVLQSGGQGSSDPVSLGMAMQPSPSPSSGPQMPMLLPASLSGGKVGGKTHPSSPLQVAEGAGTVLPQEGLVGNHCDNDGMCRSLFCGL